jgi:hypothetical protein
MKNIYKLTALGWQLVRRCQSFEAAIAICRHLQRRNPCSQFCVNN